MKLSSIMITTNVMAEPAVLHCFFSHQLVNAHVLLLLATVFTTVVTDNYASSPGSTKEHSLKLNNINSLDTEIHSRDSRVVQL